MQVFLGITEFLEWVNNKNVVIFTYVCENYNFVENIIEYLEFLDPENKQIYKLNCPINKRQNQNFLRIVRKSIFEIDNKIVIGNKIKEFLNFIPSDFNNLSKIFDVSLIQCIDHNISGNISIENIVSIFEQYYEQLDIVQKKLYDLILEPSILSYSSIEKKGFLLKKVKRKYCLYNFYNSISGRLSTPLIPNSNKFMDVLTLKKEERSIISAKDNYKFIQVDYNAMEMRVLSSLAQEPKLMNQQGDLYQIIAQYIFGTENINNKQRQLVKELCFILIFGGNEYGISKKLNIPLEGASLLIQKFYQEFPSIERWILENQIKILENREAKNIFHRTRRFSEDSSDNEILRQGQNFIVQSTANDIMIYLITELRNKILENTSILIHIHDCIIFVSPNEKVNGNIEIINEIMSFPKILNEFNIQETFCFNPVFNITEKWS